MSQVVTGEAVALDLRPARLGSRILAATIDIAIETVGLTVVLFVLSSVAVFADEAMQLAAAVLTVVGFLIGYPVAFEALWRGRTPGKAALGIRVVRDDGGPIRFRHALTRALFNVVERPGVTFGSAAVITSLLSRSGKRIGDIVAGTFVIQERVPRQELRPVFMPPQLATWASALDLSRLPDDLALAARNFLGRSAQLRPEARARLGAELASAMAATVTPGPPPGTPGWAYLAAVVAERRRRESARLPAPAGWSGPTPWQPAPPSPGWGPSPAQPPWASSAPPVGAPPAVGPPPPVGLPPHDPGPPRVPPPPSPQWGPAPTPPPTPPPEPGVPAPAEDGPFALPG